MKNFWKPLRSVIMTLLKEPKAVIGLIIFFIFILITIFAPLLATHDPEQPIAVPFQAPSAQYWLGTTGYGQDVYSQLMYGISASMVIGLEVAVITTVLAVIIGIYAGYAGGWIDVVLNWITNVFLVFPAYPLMLVIASYLPNSGNFIIVLVIAFTSWAPQARVMRAQAQTFKRRDFSLAAKMTGMSTMGIVLKEIVPNIISLIFNTFIVTMQWGIYAEAFIRFLGVGSIATPTLGNMLNSAQNGEALLNGGWWWFVPPGVAIMLITLALTLINYGVDTISNPRLQKPPKLPQEWRKKLGLQTR